jgi:hypothetical protein
VWVDNSPLVFAAWEANEPSNGGPLYVENCVVIAGTRLEKKWDDRPCGLVAGVPGAGQYSVLCQY